MTIAYFSELRANWRPVLAATFAMATGYGAMSTFATSVIAPNLLADFGWSMSAFAMLSTISLLAGISLPFAGRLADVMGVRWTALIGIVAMPLTYFAYSLMSGAMWQYVAIYLFAEHLLHHHHRDGL